MATRRQSELEPEPIRGRPGTTPEARENQLITLAYDDAERQIRDGTAAAQVITHFLKLGSSREKIEQERIKVQTRLDEERIKMTGEADKLIALAGAAFDAFRGYQGEDVVRDPDEIQE